MRMPQLLLGPGLAVLLVIQSLDVTIDSIYAEYLVCYLTEIHMYNI